MKTLICEYRVEQQELPCDRGTFFTNFRVCRLEDPSQGPGFYQASCSTIERAMLIAGDSFFKDAVRVQFWQIYAKPSSPILPGLKA